MNRISIWG